MVEFTLAIRNMWTRHSIETPSLFGIQTLVPWLRDTLVPQSCKSLRRIHLWLQIPLQSESNPLDDLFTPDHHLDDVCNRLPALRELIIQFDYVIHHTANGLRPLKPPDTNIVNEALLAAMPRLKIKLFVIVNGRFREHTTISLYVISGSDATVHSQRHRRAVNLWRPQL
ncbi:hypothetical protein PYCCODRAFT_1149717 [Trametes coccinea BRFM310]|uniref:Uncharacterized protein n=1 Tax=Trametes coccinea (strain BRFM310) TaxID=1353009 RepID=A0A1Y2IA12_TRAC3|nr:hypothetical protein PYCCODRAFT_1149717 [Trametes coccinea BRFM310]